MRFSFLRARIVTSAICAGVLLFTSGSQPAAADDHAGSDNVQASGAKFLPDAVAVDHAGNSYVVDRSDPDSRKYDTRVGKYDSSGKKVADVYSSRYRINSIAVEPVEANAAVYVNIEISAGINVVMKATPNGDGYAIRKFVENIKDATIIAVDQRQNVYVSGPGPNGTVIKEYDKIADYIREIPANFPSALAVDKQGNLFYSAANSHKEPGIYKADPSKDYETTLFTNTSVLATGIAVDPVESTVFATHGGANGGVKHYATNGTAMDDVATGLNNPQKIAADPNRRIIISTGGDNTVWQYKKDPYTVNRSWLTMLREPGQIAFDTDQNLYIAEEDGAKISKYSTIGEKITDITDGVKKPVSVAVDHAGNVYFGTHSSSLNYTVAKAEKDDDHYKKAVRFTEQDKPDAQSVAIDSRDHVFVAYASASGGVREYNPDGKFVRDLLPEIAAISVSIAPDDTIYVVAARDRQVYKAGPGEDIATPFITNIFARDLSTDSEGNIYVQATMEVIKYAPNGQQIETVMLHQGMAGRIAANRAGEIYITGKDYNIWKVTKNKHYSGGIFIK